MTLHEQLTYSLYIEESKAAMNRANNWDELNRAATCLDQPEFSAIPEHSRCELAELYSIRSFELSPVGFLA
jgi:hypothetical protein